MAYQGFLPRDAKRRYFMLPNALFNLDLAAGEIAVYAYLMCRENRKTYQCFPSYRNIGEAVGLSKNTVKKYVAGLVDKALIYTEPNSTFTKTGMKKNSSLLYTIRPIDDAIEHHYQKQLLSFAQEQQKQSGK